jgi:hypothetical protein
MVYFELFGKKMKTKVLAETPEAAKKEIMNKIIFHNVLAEDSFNQAIDLMEQFFGSIK